ncbi:CgeB family protein [Desulfolutivibrio sp.]|uniref:CgeB family protein n=1 Tax=Desulfolutivibrio sp. TaxID=2773296 RepID=UPI002F968060
MTDPWPYEAAAVSHDGALTDIRLTQAGKTRHLFGRSARSGELRLLDSLAAKSPLVASSGGSAVLPVLVGSGLGHALAALLGDAPAVAAPPVLPRLAVVDREAPLLDITGLDRAAAADPRVVWFDDPDPEAVLAAIDALCATTGRVPVPLVLPAYQRLDPGYYGAVLHGLNSRTRAAAPAARPGRDPFSACRYPRFAGDAPRVLLLSSRLFLSGEVVAACGRLGVPCRYAQVGADELDAEAFLARVAADVADFRPDFILTFNHLGLDREGYLTDLLSRLELPLASWFADNPELILGNYVRPFPSHAAAFTWDADTVPFLAQSGCGNVFHLPLAADVTRFRPKKDRDPGHALAARVSFVGNSMLAKTRTRLAHAAPHPDLAAKLSDIACGFGQSPDRSVPAFLASRHPDMLAHYQSLSGPDRTLAFETAVVWEATRLYRRDCLARVMPFFPTIVGDAGWLETFADEGRRWRRLPEMAYYDQLPDFYPRSEVNLNITSRQMKGAVNQRVFDVPACGAFLLTDRQEQMDALFDPDRESAIYAHPDELPDLVRHYLGRPDERRRIALAARRRILAEHTYDRRMETLFAVMRRLFATG